LFALLKRSIDLIPKKLVKIPASTSTPLSEQMPIEKLADFDKWSLDFFKKSIEIFLLNFPTFAPQKTKI